MVSSKPFCDNNKNNIIFIFLQEKFLNNLNGGAGVAGSILKTIKSSELILNTVYHVRGFKNVSTMWGPRVVAQLEDYDYFLPPSCSDRFMKAFEHDDLSRFNFVNITMKFMGFRDKSPILIFEYNGNAQMASIYISNNIKTLKKLCGKIYIHNLFVKFIYSLIIHTNS